MKYRCFITLSKLRLWSRCLAIEKGRRKNVPIADFYFLFCEERDITVLENEFYFVCWCPAYSAIRKQNLFCAKANYNTFGNVVSAQRIAAYIYQALRLRSALVEGQNHENMFTIDGILWILNVLYLGLDALKYAINYFLVYSLSLSSKQETSTQCWTNVDPPSTTLAQHWTNIGSMSLVCWVYACLCALMCMYWWFKSVCTLAWRWYIYLCHG